MALGTGLVTLNLTEPERRPQPQKLSSGYFDRHFERLRPFGQGAFGEVWCCKELSKNSEQNFAIKAVRYKGHTGVESSVIREAQILATLDHPNIVKCLHAWIQAEPDGGDTGGSTRASSWPSTPMTPFADREDPHSKALPALKLTEGVVTETLHFTYDATNDSDICFELQEEVDTEGICSNLEPQKSPRSAGSATIGNGPARAKTESDFGSVANAATLFLQMELCKDQTLQHWIADQNAMESVDQQKRDEAARNILIQCLRALAYLHHHSCVHRDIKPSNLLFGQDDAIRLADFGLAKWVEFSAASPRYVRGMNAGTPCYASPEQLVGKPLETSTDLFSLGIVLAELICPVQTQMERTKVLEALKERRTLPVSNALAEMAVRMTEVDPSKRPSAKELLKELGEEVADFDADTCTEQMAARASARFQSRDHEVVCIEQTAMPPCEAVGCGGYSTIGSQLLPHTMVSPIA